MKRICHENDVGCTKQFNVKVSQVLEELKGILHKKQSTKWILIIGITGSRNLKKVERPKLKIKLDNISDSCMRNTRKL